MILQNKKRNMHSVHKMKKNNIHNQINMIQKSKTQTSRVNKNKAYHLYDRCGDRPKKK